MATQPTAPYVLEIITLLQEHETLVKRLYEVFSKSYPQQESFWLSLAAEEASHARLFERLKEHAVQKLVAMRQDSLLSKDSIINENEMLRTYLRTLSEQPVSNKRAVALAKQLEEGILEKRFDLMFDTEADDSRAIIRSLISATANHAASLESLITRRDEFSRLVEDNVISGIQLELARTLAEKSNTSTESVLMSRYKVPRKSILASYESHHKMRAYDLKEKPISLPAPMIEKLAEKYDFLKSKLFLPVDAASEKLIVAIANPLDLYLRDDVQRMFPEKPVLFAVAIPDDILEAIDLLFGQNRGPRSSFANLVRDINLEGEREAATKASEKELTEEDSSVIQLVNLAIEDAFLRNASDIHFESNSDASLTVRYRIDGDLATLAEFPHYVSRAVISRLKIMCGLDIAEKRRPQSGKINFRRWGRHDLELRVETYPTSEGNEDAVLRVLASKKPLTLAELYLSPQTEQKVKELIEKPYGLFLCVGPTGSGKTTTLHSAIRHINSEKVKILTVEDPVEISQRGLRQVQVNKKAGLGFPEALRSFLRADPDVIMVGEMRDVETATIAVESSLTGHLVFSTLHTNSAAETVTRLLDMGIDPYSFSDALLGVLAQRLLRKLCPNCRTPVRPEGFLEGLRSEYDNPEAFDMFVSRNKPTPFAANPEGCEKCNMTGYKGRMAIHELLAVTDNLRSFLPQKIAAGEIHKKAVKEGMTTLKQDGIEKVLRGHTTIEEVRSVCIR